MSDDCHHHVCTGRNLRTELVDVHQHLKEVEPAVLVVLVEGAHVGRRYANCQRETPRASCLLLCLRVRAIGIQACMRLRPQWARLCVCSDRDPCLAAQAKQAVVRAHAGRRCHL